jgi:hypothetical protein
MQHQTLEKIARIIQDELTPVELSNRILMDFTDAYGRMELYDLDRAITGLLDEQRKHIDVPHVSRAISHNLDILFTIKTFRAQIAKINQLKERK